MQDQYSSLPQQNDQNGSVKEYEMSSSMPQVANSYFNEYAFDPLYGLDDTYSIHQMAANLVHDYPTTPQNSHMHATNDRIQPQHQSQPVMTNSFPPQIDSMSMVKLESPITNQIKLESNNLDNSNISSPSPKAHSTSYEFSAESGDDKNRTGEDDKKSVHLKKRPLSVPDDQKDGSYWEKRKKNNESAKRSREARRLKEQEIALRMVVLERENLHMKAELDLLNREIRNLRILLYGCEK